MAIGSAMFLVFAAAFVVGDIVGLKDTPAARVAFATTALFAGLIGGLCAARLSIPRAEWWLPFGVGILSAGWLVAPTGSESLGAVGATAALWVVVLAAVATGLTQVGKRSAVGATLIGVAGGIVVIASMPLVAVWLQAGAATLTSESMGIWAARVLSDETFSLDQQLRQAADSATAALAVVTFGTAYVVGYLLRHVRRDAPDGLPQDAAPQTV